MDNLIIVQLLVLQCRNLYLHRIKDTIQPSQDTGVLSKHTAVCSLY